MGFGKQSAEVKVDIDLEKLDDILHRIEHATEFMTKTGLALDKTIQRANRTTAALNEAARRAENAARLPAPKKGRGW